MLAAEKTKATFIAPVVRFPETRITMNNAKCNGLGYRASIVCSGTCGRTLHRGLFKPYPVLRSMCGKPAIPRLSLDILGWTGSRCSYIWGILPVCQVQQLRGGEPRPRRLRPPARQQWQASIIVVCWKKSLDDKGCQPETFLDSQILSSNI